MSTPAIPLPADASPQTARPARPAARGARFGGIVEVWLRSHSLLTYLFLYFPILVVLAFSFNGTDDRVMFWKGFSLRWYEKVLTDASIQGYLWNSLIVGFFTAVLSTTFGTMAALGLQRVGRKLRASFDVLTYVSVIIPEIVIALATLVFFASTFQIVDEVTGIRIRLGYVTIVAAHTLFNLSLVLLLVRARLAGMDRTHVEASYDLGATPWRTFWQVTFPQLLPAVVAGFLLSFTFSFDDYVITTFVSGPGSSTIPLFVFSQIRQGVTPATNAVAAIMLLITLSILVVGQFALTRNARRSGQRGGVGGVAGIVAENAAG